MLIFPKWFVSISSGPFAKIQCVYIFIAQMEKFETLDSTMHPFKRSINEAEDKIID